MTHRANTGDDSRSIWVTARFVRSPLGVETYLCDDAHESLIHLMVECTRHLNELAVILLTELEGI